MKKIKKAIIFILLISLLGLTHTIVSVAAPAFNKKIVTIRRSTEKKRRSRKLKIIGLSKRQKQEKWKFKSSDVSVAEVKRTTKISCKIISKKKDGYAVIRASQGKKAAYVLVKVGKGSEKPSYRTILWAMQGKLPLPGNGYNTASGKQGDTCSDPSGETGSTSPSKPESNDDRLPYSTMEEYKEWLKKHEASYPVVSTKTPRYNYEITVLNDKTVDGHYNRIYANDSTSFHRRQCALLYIKTNAPALHRSYNFNVSSMSAGNQSFAILVDGQYGNIGLYSVRIYNVHRDSSDKPEGGEVIAVTVTTPGVHTIEIVEDLDYSWDGYLAKYVLKSYKKTGVSVKVRYYDYEAEEERWIANTVAQCISPGMTDREKASSLKTYFLTHSHHVPVVAKQNENGVWYMQGEESTVISYISFTAYWDSWSGECIQSNGALCEMLKRAGLQAKHC